MTNSIALRIFRKWAFGAQGHRCFYCKHPMWLAKPGTFAKRYGKHLHRVDLFYLTAEHEHARRDGGQDMPTNIVAACALCKLQRHAMFPTAAPDPQTYETFVLLSVAAGLWRRCLDARF